VSAADEDHGGNCMEESGIQSDRAFDIIFDSDAAHRGQAAFHRARAVRENTPIKLSQTCLSER
jgi:hypothetical protein